MRFDDRLVTVLGQPAGDAHGRAVQWRQLVELVARDGGQGDAQLRDHALARIAQLMDEVPATLLAPTARAVAGPTVPAELVALFAARGAAASAALVTAADLDPAGWAAVRAVAAPDLHSLLPPASAPSEEPAQPASATREPADAESQRPAPEAGIFRWECGPTGEIDWVEGGPRAGLIGRSLTEPFADRFAARLPFSDEPLVLVEEGALAGEWRWSGSPAFFADSGRFAGYRGIARREGAEPAAAASPLPQLPEDDDLRELMHELRTPLNAIIGFGEIIEGQYLGPAHLSYRSRAGAIVRHARRLADAVDNLDLAAKLRSGRFQGEAETELSDLRGAIEAIAADASRRSVTLRVEDRAGSGRVALPPAMAPRLVEQFAAALADTAAAGETLALVLDRLPDQLAIGLDRPRALAGLSEEQMLVDTTIGETRFALRLVQGLAAMVGGRLDIAADRLVLLLPLVRG
ncbi:hypothetical protein GCM10022280_13720 [Sphingomonas swuensis]|uniref:histidine kinase n=1 Tax=Sphingomonas swuensis TaxID=977800 RepID=A0ABP7ST85_9SPHN